jgi:pimeloyl-ACP methyl ester carboxylesterase
LPEWLLGYKIVIDMEWRSFARKTGKVLCIAAGSIVGAFSVSTVLAAWFMVRPGKKGYDCIPRISGGKLEPLTLTTSDGLQLHAWVQLSRRSNSNNWVLLLHGYRSDRDILQTRRRFFIRRGYHTLLLHFRGHGSSDAARISWGYHERKDIKAAFDFMKLLNSGQPVHIGIDGISMGAAAAVYAVAYESIQPDWMILESCYDNIRQALANRLALHVVRPFVPIIARPLEFVGEHLFRLNLEELNVVRALMRIQCPVLVLAGDSEKVLKTAEVQLMYDSIPEPKRLILFPGAGHEDFLVRDPRRYIRGVTLFLRRFAPLLPSTPEAPVSIARRIVEKSDECLDSPPGLEGSKIQS